MKPPVIFAALCAMTLLSQSARAAEQVGRETDITELRLGQRILVDDGSCPSGQIKEVSGAQLSQNGVVRVVRCVPRPGSRR
jgi:hypothetical protein